MITSTLVTIRYEFIGLSSTTSYLIFIGMGDNKMSQPVIRFQPTHIHTSYIASLTHLWQPDMGYQHRHAITVCTEHSSYMLARVA